MERHFLLPLAIGRSRATWSREFLTVGEITEILKVNQQTARNWIDRGQLPAVRVGSRRGRVRRTAFDRFLDQGATAKLTNAIGEGAVTRSRDAVAQPHYGRMWWRRSRTGPGASAPKSARPRL